MPIFAYFCSILAWLWPDYDLIIFAHYHPGGIISHHFKLDNNPILRAEGKSKNKKNPLFDLFFRPFGSCIGSKKSKAFTHHEFESLNNLSSNWAWTITFIGHHMPVNEFKFISKAPILMNFELQVMYAQVLHIFAITGL